MRKAVSVAIALLLFMMIAACDSRAVLPEETEAAYYEETVPFYAKLQEEIERLEQLLWDNRIVPNRERHPIDVAHIYAHETHPENFVTNVMVEITLYHAGLWREEMERYFDQLMEELDEYGQELLALSSQERWEVFAEANRDLERALLPLAG